MHQRPCLDCGTLTTTATRCGSCRRAVDRRRQAERGQQPYQSRAWRMLSQATRTARPWCEMCGRTDDLTVDHLDPISTGGALLASPDRLRVLCRTCHGRATKHRRQRDAQTR